MTTLFVTNSTNLCLRTLCLGNRLDMLGCFSHTQQKSPFHMVGLTFSCPVYMRSRLIQIPSFLTNQVSSLSTCCVESVLRTYCNTFCELLQQSLQCMFTTSLVDCFQVACIVPFQTVFSMFSQRSHFEGASKVLRSCIFLTEQ